MTSETSDRSARPTDPSGLLYAAKIDYATFEVAGRCKLPVTTGRVSWSRKYHYKRFSIHDPTPNDLANLGTQCGPLPLLELEIAVDVRPAEKLNEADHRAVLETVMVDGFARRLDPRKGLRMKQEFRAFYRKLPEGYQVGPFNKRLPAATDQQLHGFRTDDAQVKCYLKRKDHGLDVIPSKQVARVEVRLRAGGLKAHQLGVISDLNGFAYRKRLMPYFRHVAGARPSPNKSGTALGNVICVAVDKLNRDHWNEAGVGAYQPGGRREHHAVRLRRDRRINDRIGQALYRLERSCRREKFVCTAVEGQTEGR